MRKLIVSEFVTLDGVLEDPGGAEGFDRGGWAFQFERGEDGDRFKYEELVDADALLLGRTTYEGFAEAWPSRTEGGFAEKMNGIAKYVVSSTLRSADWNNSTILSGDIGHEVAGLKGAHGDNILVAGSAQLVSALVDHDLVDEYRLMVFPLVLGRGKRLFADQDQARALRLIEAQPVGPDGVITLRYERKR